MLHINNVHTFNHNFRLGIQYIILYACVLKNLKTRISFYLEEDCNRIYIINAIFNTKLKDVSHALQSMGQRSGFPRVGCSCLMSLLNFQLT